MLNLYTLNETFTNGLSYSLLDIIFILSVFSSVAVIISKNPIISVLFLIALFMNIAAYLIMIGLNFIGLSYLLVYVGAVSILFLFILMLINVRISELITDNNNSLPLAVIIGICFNVTFYKLLPYNYNTYKYANLSNFSNTEEITSMYNSNTNIFYNVINDLFYHPNNYLYFVSSHIWDGVIAEASHITSIGNVIYTVYPLWLIITSIILLLAMVGSIVITIKQ